jgi:hypothetical protein
MSVFNDVEVLRNFYGVTTTKGDVIVNDGLKNNRLPIGTDKFVITADSTQPYGLKWSDPRFNDIIYTQLILATLPISTNSTTPVPITEFQLTPTIGKYIIFYNLLFSMSTVVSRTTTFSIYKNGTLVANSSRVINSYAIDTYNTFTTQFVVLVNGTDVLSIRYNVSNNDTTTDIISGNLNALKFSADLT